MQVLQTGIQSVLVGKNYALINCKSLMPEPPSGFDMPDAEKLKYDKQEKEYTDCINFQENGSAFKSVNSPTTYVEGKLKLKGQKLNPNKNNDNPDSLPPNRVGEGNGRTLNVGSEAKEGFVAKNKIALIVAGIALVVGTSFYFMSKK